MELQLYWVTGTRTRTDRKFGLQSTRNTDNTRLADFSAMEHHTKLARISGTPTRTALFSHYILDWRCYLTRYVMGQHVRKFGLPNARLREDTGLEIWKFGPKMPKTAKNRGTLTRDARFREIPLELQHSPTRHTMSQLV